MVLVGSGSSEGWITVTTAGAAPGSSSLLCVSYQCQVVFPFPQWTLSFWASTAALSTPVISQAGCWVSHCDNSPFSPVGLPSLWASSPCLTFPPFFSKLGSGSYGELCGEDKYLLLESQSLTAGQCREKGLWIKPCCWRIIFWMG